MFECWLLFKRVGLPASMRLTTGYRNLIPFSRKHIDKAIQIFKNHPFKKKERERDLTSFGESTVRLRGGKS